LQILIIKKELIIWKTVKYKVKKIIINQVLTAERMGF